MEDAPTATVSLTLSVIAFFCLFLAELAGAGEAADTGDKLRTPGILLVFAGTALLSIAFARRERLERVLSATGVNVTLLGIVIWFTVIAPKP